MASSSTCEDKNNIFNHTKAFPPVIEGRINVIKFLEASAGLITIIERLGSVFAPVKYDMQGNIDKIVKNFKYNEDSCLLELILQEASCGKHLVTEGILWFNRALLFFELAFVEILKHVKENNVENVNMKKIFTVAYEGSVKKYHSWVTQQVFNFICKMSPTLPQALAALGAEHNMQDFETKLETYNVTLHLVRSKIDDFFQDNNLLVK